MSDNDVFFRALHDEIVKQAFLGTLGRKVVRGVGKGVKQLTRGQARQAAENLGHQISTPAMDAAALGGGGAAVGGVGGLGVGAYEGYQEGGLGGAATKALERGQQGAIAGGVLGAGGGVAGAGRLGGGKVLRAVTEGSNPLAMAGRFGQRQLHSVTGMAPDGAKRGTKEYADALRKMRIFGWDQGTRVRDARTALDAAKADPKSGSKFRRALESVGVGRKGGAHAAHVKKLKNRLSREMAEKDLADTVMERGLSSVPGMAQEMISRRSAKPLWDYGIKPQATQQGLTGKAMLGLPVVMAGSELMTDQDGEGRGRSERFSKALAEGAAYGATPYIPTLGSDLIARNVGAGAGLAGRQIDNLIGAIQPTNSRDLGEGPGAVPPEEEDGQGGIPVERVMSNAAQGKPPEDLMV